jgi:3-dehydroquinate dehydratase
LIKNAKEPRPKLIISEHGICLPKKEVVKYILDDAFSKGADIAKGAFPVTTLEDLSSMYNILDEISNIYEGRYTVMGMGEIGSSVRIMAPRYKMALVYACLPSKPLVEGQIPITKLKRIWKLLGLIQNV